MLTRYLRAKLCLVIHTITISCLSAVIIGMMRVVIHAAQLSPAVG